MNGAALEARDLHKEFGEGAARVVAVESASLEVRAGEVLMVMGPSGSGKTTLLTMLGLLQTPDRGDVAVGGQTVAGRSRAELAALRRTRIGFVFQNFQLLPSLTARENVELAANLGGRRGADARDRATHILEDLGMGHRLGARPRTLSGGEKQRVAIARALVNEPLVVLADEPTANLDSAHGDAVIRMLREAAKSRGCAVLIVSHDERICPHTDAMQTMEDGRLGPRTPPTRTHAPGGAVASMDPVRPPTGGGVPSRAEPGGRLPHSRR